MRALSVLICTGSALMFTACAGSIAPSKLEPPAKILMAAPKNLPEPKAGDDLVQEHTKLRRSYATESSKLSRLQRYVRTILGN